MKNGLLILIGILFYNLAVAQNVEFKSSNFKDKKNDFKAIMVKKKVADLLLEQANDAVALVNDPGNKFQKAQKIYFELMEFNPNSARINMNIGNCYLYTNEKYKAKKYIDKAYELDKEVDPFLHFLMGQSLLLNSEFKEATKFFKMYEEEAKNKYVEEYKKLITKYKKESKYGLQLMATKERVWVDNVETINSPQDDYSPALSVDGELLMFTSRRKNSHQPNEFGDYDNDIYTSSFKNGKWGAPKNVGAPLSTANDEAASALSYDGQRLLLWKVDDDKISYVYESKLDGLKWGEPKKKMSYIVSKHQNNTFACYEPLDIKIYYITDKRGNKNIDFSGLMVQYDNKWGKGQSISHQINSKFHEGSVYITPSGNTVYFCSQGHNSMGGYDIFVSHKNPITKQWLPPVNMGYPINTPYDDMFFAATANGKYAYIASNRPGGKGGMDIYKVTFWGPEKPVLVDTEDYLLASIAKPVKDINLAKPVTVENNSLTVFKGMIKDAITRKPMQASLEITDNDKGKVISKFLSNSATGKFLLSLPSGKNYGIAVKADGYLFHSENFNIPNLSEFNMINKTIELKNIKIGSKIQLRNVFFATGKSDVTPASYPELNRLLKLMKDVPGLKIEISGHTDNQGSDATNLKLSKERALAVMTYVTGKGLAKNRITSKGYGSTKPIGTNDTAEGRQNNRRTELLITDN